MQLWPKPRNEFERRWIRGWLTNFLPGAVIFGIGGVSDLKLVVIGGWLIVLAWAIRAWRLIHKFRRCTGCGWVSYPRIGDDGTCFYCGVELPLDGLDRPPGLN